MCTDEYLSNPNTVEAPSDKKFWSKQYVEIYVRQEENRGKVKYKDYIDSKSPKNAKEMVEYYRKIGLQNKKLSLK